MVSFALKLLTEDTAAFGMLLPLRRIGYWWKLYMMMTKCLVISHPDWLAKVTCQRFGVKQNFQWLMLPTIIEKLMSHPLVKVSLSVQIPRMPLGYMKGIRKGEIHQ